MTTAEKLTAIKSLLNITDNAQDDVLTTYLTLSRDEILSWIYSATGSIPGDVTDVPMWYEPSQIMSVLAGYGISGAENQMAHSENGISRTFKYEDMISYIRAHVLPYAGVC